MRPRTNTRSAVLVNTARKVVGPPVAAVALCVVTAVPAHAQEPLTGICAFPISHEFPKVHGIHGHELPPASPYEGFDTGQVGVVITNLDTGRSVEAFANSAAFFLDENGGYFRGQSIAFFDSPRGDVPTGAWVINGNVRVALDDTDAITAVSGGVIRRDLCAELA